MKKRILALALALALLSIPLPVRADEAELLTVRLPGYSKGVYWPDAGADYALLPVTKDYRNFRGYQDDNGRVVLDLRTSYDGGRLFREGLAAVWKGDGDAARYGFIDKLGREVIPVRFTAASDFYEGLASVSFGTDWSDTVINTQGQIVFTRPGEDIGPFREGLAWAGTQGRYGFIDTTGKVVVEQRYAAVGSFSEGLAWFRTGEGRYGYLNAAGEEVIPAKYTSAGDFRDGRALAGIGEGYVVLDPAGNTRLALEQPWAVGPWEDGVILIAQAVGEKLYYGAVDVEGNFLLPAKYLACLSYCEGRFVVADDTGMGVVDRTGAGVTRLAYEDAMVLPGGRILLNDTAGYTGWFSLLGGEGMLREPADTTAYPSGQRVLVDGKQVEFHMYALKDERGYLTNYVRLRDVAYVLNGTQAQFQVEWEEGHIYTKTRTAYTAIGGEMTDPELNGLGYSRDTDPLRVDGVAAQLQGLVFYDAAGLGYTYYKIRDLGLAMGFNVRWDNDAGCIRVETDRGYTG